MCLLLETICVNDGEAVCLTDHLQRMQRSSSAIFGESVHYSDGEFAPFFAACRRGKYKCRVLYDRQIRSISCEPYMALNLRSLRCVHDDDITYDHKWADRHAIDRLFERRRHADDVLICRGGWLCDTSYANVAAFDGRQWWTPDTYLLNGTKRQRLLRSGQLRSRPLRIEDLSSFEYVSPINAMLDPGEIRIDVAQIHF